jgi:hypothetical protein
VHPYTWFPSFHASKSYPFNHVWKLAGKVDAVSIISAAELHPLRCQGCTYSVSNLNVRLSPELQNVLCESGKHQ